MPSVQASTGRCVSVLLILPKYAPECGTPPQCLTAPAQRLHQQLLRHPSEHTSSIIIIIIIIIIITLSSS